ncbi:hypothetical protein [Methanobacterium sp. ACI-7]|uniref:hypothetical protein n=1 Tax=unclassified Methanobacterium TaxID=2627676 RepID=UPI0039C3E629
MVESDDDKHKIVLLPVIMCLTALIGGSFAVNVQSNQIHDNIEIELIDTNHLAILNKTVNKENFNKSIDKIVSFKNSQHDNIANNEKLQRVFAVDENRYEKNTFIIDQNGPNNQSDTIWDLNGTKKVYLTSDRIIDSRTDYIFLKRVAKNLESSGIDAEIDPGYSNPDQVPRSIKHAPKNSTVIIVNYNCAGTIKDLCDGTSGPLTNGNPNEGYLYDYAKDLKGIVYVNVSPEVILTNSNYLPRAYDDNFSGVSFRGLKNPAEYLKQNGIVLIDNLEPLNPVMGAERADLLSKKVIELTK